MIPEAGTKTSVESKPASSGTFLDTAPERIFGPEATRLAIEMEGYTEGDVGSSLQVELPSAKRQRGDELPAPAVSCGKSQVEVEGDMANISSVDPKKTEIG